MEGRDSGLMSGQDGPGEGGGEGPLIGKRTKICKDICHSEHERR